MERLVKFICERYSIFLKRRSGLPPPWTTDPILREYRFCNVCREDDKVTKWVASHWRAPNEDVPELWFAMYVARVFNTPATLAAVGFPVPFDGRGMAAKLKMIDGVVWSSAYVITTHGQECAKAEFYCERVFPALWERRREFQYINGAALSEWHSRFVTAFGVGMFLGAQVVADMKYISSWRPALDWWTFSASGPGSRRGLNRVLGRPVDAHWSETEWRQRLGEIYEQYKNQTHDIAILPRLHAQDLQNCLCEFDKYERVRLGEGRPRQRYHYPQAELGLKEKLCTY